MQIEYKFWFIRRDDDGFITEAAIRFFLGQTIAESEKGEQVTRFRRTDRVRGNVLNQLGYTVISDGAGNPAVLLTPNDFGSIKTDDELRSYCSKQIKKVPGHTPVDNQK